MSTSAPPDNDGYIHAKDGYHVDLQVDEQAETATLILFFNQNGVCEWYVHVHEYTMAAEEFEPGEPVAFWVLLAKARRMYLLWAAVCGFLNAGGRLGDFMFHCLWDVLGSVVKDCRAGAAKDRPLDPVSPPDGFHLLSTCRDEFGENFEHVFAREASDSDEVIVWHENVAVARRSIWELERMISLMFREEADDLESRDAATEVLDFSDTEAEGAD